jgi:di/tricarboxylate transporter
MKNTLIALFTILFLWVTYVVIDTSYQSNLFKEWDFLMSIPWMQATLWDFYANILVLLLWVYYKESNIAVKGLWTVLFILLGSIAVTGYVLLQLFKLKTGEGLEHVLVKRS